MARAAVYCRISDDAEGYGAGVARQKADCLQRAAYENWQVVQVFEDNDRGASRHSKRPRRGFEAMLELVRCGGADVILAYSNSRLTRRPAEFEELVKLAERGVLIRTIVSGDDDLATADGLMVARVKAAVDAAESDRTSERARRKVAEKFQRGEWLGGPRPFGWQDDTTTLNQIEANMIREGAQHILEGGSVGELIRKWNASGVTSARGNLWRHSTVNRVLTRWRNAGVQERYGEPHFDIETPWTPIMGRETVERLRVILSDPKRGKAHGYAPVHLMAGIVRCGKCGSVMKSGAVKSRKGTVTRMYRCSGPSCYIAINMRALDDAVSARIIALYESGVAEASTAARDETKHLLAKANEELADVLRQRAEIEQAINDELITFAAMRPKLLKIKDAEGRIRAERERIQRQDVHATLIEQASKVFTTDSEGRHRASFEQASLLRQRWATLDLAAKRRLIRAMLNVQVFPGRGDDRIEITDT